MFFKKKNKIICLSVQRTGTTSVGDFFKKFNYKVAGYEEGRTMDWAAKRLLGDYEGILNSNEFIKNEVFEDSPWWEGDFYRFLYHRLPEAKFILFLRDSNKWFDSMMNHSNGKTLGNTFRHSRVYRREIEFYNTFPDLKYYENLNNIDNLLRLGEEKREHYTSLYELRNKEVIDFFNALAPSSLFVCKLEDELKWHKLGAFFNIDVPNGFDIHSNKTYK